MTMKSLKEAAAEILNKSRSNEKEAMHKLSNTGSGLDTVVDLGGATYENPEGGETGKKTAAARGTATPPGTQPDSDKKEGMHTLDGAGGSRSAAKSVSMQKAGEEESPEDHNGEHSDRGTRNKAAYAHPTSEETEVEEIVAEEPTEEELEEAKAERWENAKAKMKEMSVKEDIDALFSGETLTEEFKTKAETIFEAAVISRALAVAEVLEEEILDAAQQALDDSRVEIEEQVDTYLNFVVENWVKENQVAIETGLRSEIVEDFINGLKNLFTENYIDIPADKVDVVEEQAQEIADLQKEINEVMNVNAELAKELAESNKAQILATVSEGLTATQAAKLKTLAEGVEFVTEDEYTGKLSLIRENYFKTDTKLVNTDNASKTVRLFESAGPAEVENTEVVSSGMNSLVAALRTQNQ